MRCTFLSLLSLLVFSKAGIADRLRDAALAAAKSPFEPLRAPLEAAFAGLRRRMTGGAPLPATGAALLAAGFSPPSDADAPGAPWFAAGSERREPGYRTLGAVAQVLHLPRVPEDFTLSALQTAGPDLFQGYDEYILTLTAIEKRDGRYALLLEVSSPQTGFKWVAPEQPPKFSLPVPLLGMGLPGGVAKAGLFIGGELQRAGEDFAVTASLDAVCSAAGITFQSYNLKSFGPFPLVPAAGRGAAKDEI